MKQRRAIGVLGGRHVVVPLHASIQESCRKLGFDNLAPIIWHKIANANFGNGLGGQLPGQALRAQRRHQVTTSSLS